MVTSERRKAANRANARRSTGPKTKAGKQAVRLNGIRHGLLSRDVVLPDEDADAFEDLGNRVRADLAPVGPVEEFLVQRMVNAMWRLRRLEMVEVGVFHWRIYGIKVEQLTRKVRSFEKTALELLPFGETVISDKASHAEATEELGRVWQQRERDEVLLGRAIDADAANSDSFGKLARYETSLERSLYKALHEFQRLQAARLGQPVPLPEAVDVDISVSA